MVDTFGLQVPEVGVHRSQHAPHTMAIAPQRAPASGADMQRPGHLGIVAKARQRRAVARCSCEAVRFEECCCFNPTRDRIRVLIRKCFSWGWLAAAAFSCLTSCSKPKPNAPTQDFARRHQCPVGRVETSKEGTDRMRVSGCEESEVYVRSCANRGGALPPVESHQPVTEGEARRPLPQAPLSEPGCAWAREQKSPPPPAGSAPQPKWLSTP